MTASRPPPPEELGDLSARLGNGKRIDRPNPRPPRNGDRRHNDCRRLFKDGRKAIALGLVAEHRNDGGSVEDHQASPLRSSKNSLSALSPVNPRATTLRRIAAIRSPTASRRRGGGAHWRRRGAPLRSGRHSSFREHADQAVGRGVANAQSHAGCSHPVRGPYVWITISWQPYVCKCAAPRKFKPNPNLAKSSQICPNWAKPRPNPTKPGAWISLSESSLFKDLRRPPRAFFLSPPPSCPIRSRKRLSRPSSPFRLKVFGGAVELVQEGLARLFAGDGFGLGAPAAFELVENVEDRGDRPDLLEKRVLDEETDRARLRWARLEQAMRLAAGLVANGLPHDLADALARQLIAAGDLCIGPALAQAGEMRSRRKTLPLASSRRLGRGTVSFSVSLFSMFVFSMSASVSAAARRRCSP